MEAKKQLHLIAFNNPYPPNFGGAIDMFYKIKALSSLGVKLYLHVFYNDRDDVSGLEHYCEKLYLYKQNRSFTNHLGMLPFIVKSRYSKALIANIKKIKAPILFESLRTCNSLIHQNFDVKTAVRCHNIEYDYSWGLYKSENKVLHKLAHLFEGYKQKRFEGVLNKADILFNISKFENDYFSKYKNSASIYLPVFQGNETIVSKNGFGDYALYHGDLSSADNLKSALFLIEVFKPLGKPLVIASAVGNDAIKRAISNFPNITFSKIETDTQLMHLIQYAHINTLYSFQRSGTKLKVFTALFHGRHCMLNKNMVDDENILAICTVAEDKETYRRKVLELFNIKFEVDKKRIEALKRYNDMANAKIIIDNLL